MHSPLTPIVLTLTGALAAACGNVPLPDPPTCHENEALHLAQSGDNSVGGGLDYGAMPHGRVVGEFTTNDGEQMVYVCVDTTPWRDCIPGFETEERLSYSLGDLHLDHTLICAQPADPE